MFRRITFSIVLASLAFLFASCSSEPTQEAAAAKSAMDQAVAAEAETYASADYQSAKETLDEAQAAIKAENEKFSLFRDYEPTVAKLNQAKAQFAAAAETAKTEKEKVRQETEQALAEAEQALTSAREMLAKAPKGKGTKADLAALAADLDAVSTALDSARQSITSGKYMEAKTKISSAKSQAESITSEVEQAIAKKGRRS